MQVNASLDFDGNRKSVQSNEAFKLESTWVFAAATTGAIAVHTLFNVTGNVLLTIFGVVDTTPTSAGAPTIEVGTAGNTAVLIAQSLALSLADGEVWVDGTLTRVGAGAVPAMQVINDGVDVDLKVATATVTAGSIDFYCLWRPLSSDGLVTVATPA
jgi:hypothetical protein